MDELFHIIKANLCNQLEKIGADIYDLENELASTDLTKTADMNLLEKLIMGGTSGLAGLVGRTAEKAPDIFLASALGTGALGGGLLYGMDRHISNQDKKLKEQTDEVDRVRGLTGQIKSDYDLK